MGAVHDDGPGAQPTVGGMLGRYEVIKHLAQGGMAEVLLGRSSGIEGFERYVVIKRIRWDQARDQQFVKMFLDEARLAASLHHNNILQVHDIGEEAGEYFFTMEYLHGQDLRKLLKRVVAREELVPLEQVITIVINAASGLHFAHEHLGPDRQPLGIVHRDVSLSNIMVGYDGFVKVTDFGIAKAAMRSAETRSGVLKGKVAYMSPEQCLGKSVDRRSDVYSLGIVLYELATARRLFKADSDFLTMSAIVDGKIPPPSTLRPEISPELEAILLKALARRPANRYQTADELRAALEDFAVASHLRMSGTALASYMKRVFGDQPEPWVADAPVDEPDDSDFDGSASGLVGPLTDMLNDLSSSDTPAPSSPIAKARTRAITDLPVVRPRAASEPALSQGVVEPPNRSRALWWIGGGVIAVAATLAIVIGMRSPDVASPPTPALDPEPAPSAASDPAPAPRPPPTPSPEPIAGSGAAPPTPSPEPLAAGSSVAEPVKTVDPRPAPERKVIRPAPKPPRPPKRPPPKPGTQPKWDPNELIPK